MFAAAILFILIGIVIILSIRRIKPGTCGVHFRLGRVAPAPRRAGFHLIIPGIDRLISVNCEPHDHEMQVSDIVTSDTSMVSADVLFSYQVIDANKAVTEVADYREQTIRTTQIQIRQAMSTKSSRDIRFNQKEIGQQVHQSVDQITRNWGVQILSLEIMNGG